MQRTISPAEASVLFIADNSVFSNIASRCVAEAFGNVTTVFYERGDYPKPELNGWEGDWIISFKSDLILPKRILKRATCGSINIHPAPPKYRGVGGYIWALRNRDERYGITCHQMVERLDAGSIICVRYFPILPCECSTSLKMRAGIYCLQVLNDLLPLLIANRELPTSDEVWSERLYTYRDLDQITN